jgi:hypothetical protein
MQCGWKLLAAATLGLATTFGGAHAQTATTDQQAAGVPDVQAEAADSDRGGHHGDRVKPPPRPSVQTKVEPGVPAREKNKREHGHHHDEDRGRPGGRP